MMTTLLAFSMRAMIPFKQSLINIKFQTIIHEIAFGESSNTNIYDTQGMTGRQNMPQQSVNYNSKMMSHNAYL